MIPSDIDPGQTIYRFMNFFDAYNLVAHHTLRFTKLFELKDLNEGVGKVLRDLELSPVFPYPRDLQQLKAQHDIVRQTIYTTCWSKAPDDIAMWAIYSPDDSGMRIKTTGAKLAAVIEKYKNEYTSHANKIEGFQPSQVDIFEMNYKDLREAKKEIEKNVNATIAAMRESNIGKTKPESCRAWHKTMRERLGNVVLENDAGKYKDIAYTHEKEIRAQIEFEALDEDAHDYLHSQVCDFREFPKAILVSVDEDFIEEICIDPRCLDYKEEIFKEIINLNGKWNWMKSEVFGEVLKTISI